MIGKISGSLIMLKPPLVIVETHGLGYEIDLPISDCALLPVLGSQVGLYTHLVVREDAHSLYGFLQQETRDCFRTLIKVSGIGPKIALALLSTLNVNELHRALDQADLDMLCRTPGIGKKMAERMLLELKGKLHIACDVTQSSGKMDIFVNNSVRADIANALISLGFNDKEIRATLKNLPEVNDLSSGIKEALKLLNKL